MIGIHSIRRNFSASLPVPVLKRSSCRAKVTESECICRSFRPNLKESCLDQMIFFGEDMLRNAIREFVAHYHFERNHQGLENRLLVPLKITSTRTPVVHKRERLDGLLNYYYREAA
jgi:hypothetical protein